MQAPAWLATPRASIGDVPSNTAGWNDDGAALEILDLQAESDVAGGRGISRRETRRAGVLLPAARISQGLRTSQMLCPPP